MQRVHTVRVDGALTRVDAVALLVLLDNDGVEPERARLIAGHAVNPMLQTELSRIPLATLADRYRLGHGYDPETSFRAALAAECDQDLATRLAIDAPLFQEQGRRGLTSEQLERLSAGYSALPGTMAAEVVAWLAATGTGHL